MNVLRAARCTFWVVALLLAATGPAGAREVETPRYELVFSRHGDAARSHYDIWRVCADGTQLASLVVAEGTQFQVAVSPDGSELVYVDRAAGGSDLRRRSFDGAETENLTDHPATDSGPAYSPDGQRLAFFSDRDGGKPELYVMELASGAVERLTTNELHDSGAVWTPSGDAILLTRYFPAPEGTGPGRGEIVRLDLGSGEEERLTDLGGYNGDVDVSPDGSTIAFHRSAEAGAEIWLMAADGSDPRQITATPVDEYTPRWSPDGEWIAFTAGTGHDGLGTFDLWLMRSDGSGRRLVVGAANTEAWLAWRPGRFCR